MRKPSFQLMMKKFMILFIVFGLVLSVSGYDTDDGSEDDEIEENEDELIVYREHGKENGTYYYHVDDGWYYHINDASRPNVVYFKCVFYERWNCRGRAVLRLDGDGFYHSKPHNRHEPDILYCEELRLRQLILERCRSLECTTFRQIVDEEGLRFDQYIRDRVTLVRMRTPMQNARNSMLPQPPPASLLELTNILQDPEYRVMSMSSDGQDSIYLGSVTATNNSHHVVFSSIRLMQFFGSSSVIHSDGTFKIVPPALGDAVQVFVIATSWMDTTIPLVWALMSSQTQVAYRAVLMLIRHRLPDIQITQSISDFERAIPNAWEDVFGDLDVHHQGCFYHFAHAVMLYARELGLTRLIRNSLRVRSWVRCMCAISLLPLYLMRRAVFLLADEAHGFGDRVYGQLRPLLAYMWNYWVNNRVRSRWMCVFRSQTRTNNMLESHNRRLRDVIGVNPTAYKFIDGIRRIEDRAASDIRTLDDGNFQASRRRRNSAVANDVRLNALAGYMIREYRAWQTIRHQRNGVRMRNANQRMNEAILRYLRRASRTIQNLFNNVLDLEDE